MPATEYVSGQANKVLARCLQQEIIEFLPKKLHSIRNKGAFLMYPSEEVNGQKEKEDVW